MCGGFSNRRTMLRPLMSDGSVSLVTRLAARRHHAPFPPDLRARTEAFLDGVLGLLYPLLSEGVDPGEAAVAAEIAGVRARLERLLGNVAPSLPAGAVAGELLEGLPDLVDALDADADAIFRGDPAAHSVDEVVLTYPGFYAIAVNRIARVLHKRGVPLLPRLLSEYAHTRTGIDLHPGARIGRRFCIDHGTGVVIGETSVIGDGVKLYQGVTLGALTVQKELAGQKRHPTLEDDVVIYAGATILGGNTVIGRGTIVAGNAFVTRSVPPDSIVGRSGEVRPRSSATFDLDFVI
jgi:serine O-acetyltransferase